jgi:hypothetical protein
LKKKTEVIKAESQAFKEWQKPWEGRILAEGDYFESDGDWEA